MINVLVTGATGFIGSHIVADLSKSKTNKLRLLVRYRQKEIQCKTAEIIYGDLFNVKSLINACMGIDLIIHVAGGGQLNDGYGSLSKLNIKGTKNLVYAAKKNKVKKILYLSSCSVVSGLCDEKPINEKKPYSPFGVYGLTKAKAEMVVKKSGLDYVIVRPSIVYGTNIINENINNSGLAQISKMIDLISRGKFMVPGRGENLLHLTYINNLTQAISKIIQKWPKNQVFIIADSNPVTFIQLVHIISKELHIIKKIRHLPIQIAKMFLFLKLIIGYMKNDKIKINAKMIDFISRSRHYSIHKAKDLIGYFPVSSESGIKKTISWLKDTVFVKAPTLTFWEALTCNIRILRFILIKLHEKIKRKDTGFVYFDITHKCNLRCAHCYYFRNNPVNHDMPISYWYKVFTQFRQKGYTQAAIAGGEPALRMKIINLANHIFPILTIFSNGTIKIDKSIKQRIFISLDGPKVIHDQIRGKGTFDRLYRNYVNDKRVILRMAITSKNYKYIADFVKTAKKMNVGGVGFVLYSVDVNDASNLDLNPEQLAFVKIHILKVIKENSKFVVINGKMLNAMINGEFINKCGMKKSPSFFPNGRKKKCALHSVDCSSCRCSTAALMHIYKKDFKSFLLACKFVCG